MPEILSVMNVQNKVRTLYFEGISGFKQALWYRMEENVGKELIGFYALAENMNKESYEISWDWVEDMLKNNISVRGFVPVYKTLTDYREVDKKYNREMRELPYEDYSSETSIDVLDNFVRLIDLTGDEPQAVIIENDRMSKMVKQIFEMMWKFSCK